MRDFVFIGWSRNRDLAIAIKNILDLKGFICVVGGVYEYNPESVRGRKGTVNETINYQMNHCDQSILLFQKIDDNLGISGNLIYELGYINAQYNYIESSTKLHIFKIDITQADDNLFPSDLHGIWGTNISSIGRSIEDIAQEIVEVFLNNQAQIKKNNKFKLLNNHYYIEYEMKRHFNNPSMSDYDLAVYMLIYVQSAFCYQEQNDIKLKFKQFRNKMIEESVVPSELDWVTNYAIQTLTLYCLTIPDETNGDMQIRGSTFRGLLGEYNEIGESIGHSFIKDFGTDDLCQIKCSKEFIKKNDFEAWLIAQMQEHVTYLILVYLCNPELSEEEIKKYAALGVEFGKSSIENLELLSACEEDKMYAYLLLSYAYKNMSTFYSHLNNTDEVEKNQRKYFKLRKELFSYNSKISTIRPSLKDYIALEYLLQAIEKVKVCEDKYERVDYILEIKEYIEKRGRLERNRNYMLNMLIDEYNQLKEVE